MTQAAPLRVFDGWARLDYVDGLRAIAALWILLGHTIETSVPRRILDSPLAGPILATVFRGQVAVIAFLVISGFCLYFPCVRRNPDRPVLGVPYGRYIVRRARRIMPPYFAAGVLGLMLASVPGIQIGRWAETTPVDRWVLLSHATMLHNLIPTHATKIDYPMWSLGLEWQLYLIFPALAWAFRRFGGVYVLAVCNAIMMLDRLTFRGLPPALGAALRNGPIGFVAIFCAGMLAATITVRHRFMAPRWLLSILAIVGLAIVRASNGAGFVHDVGATTAVFCTLMLTLDHASFVSRILRTPWLVAIGSFSYSLYLTHAFCLHLTWLALRHFQLSAELTFLFLVVLCGPISIGVAYAFHRMFELPFMNTRPQPLKVQRDAATLEGTA